MSIQYIYNYIRKAIEKGIDEEIILKRVRCMFTTYVIMEDILEDTSYCDITISNLHCAMWSLNIDHDKFYDYMAEFIV